MGTKGRCRSEQSLFTHAHTNTYKKISGKFSRDLGRKSVEETSHYYKFIIPIFSLLIMPCLNRLRSEIL